MHLLGDTAVGKTAICHVAGNDATAFPKTYNCVRRLPYIYRSNDHSLHFF